MHLHAGQLGTGMNIGMTGHHHKYGMSTNFLQNALQNGMSKRDLVKDMMVTDIALNAEEKEAKKAQKKNKDSRDGTGFEGFRGFDGFGSGYYHTKAEKEAMRRRRGKRGGRGRMNPAAITFGLRDEERRRLIYDENDVDIYDYEDIENQRKCLLFQNDNVYEICVGYDYVDIKRFIKREEKLINVNSKNNENENGIVVDIVDDDFINYIGFEHSKYQSMMNNDNIYNKLKLNDNDYTHYINIYEFIYDDIAQEEQQCFDHLIPFGICLSINDENEMIVNIENKDFDINNQFSFNFSNDADWNEIDEITINEEKDDNNNVIEKCVRLFETKICMHCENDTEWKLLLYKTA